MILNKQLSTKECADTGMAFVLISLIAYLILRQDVYLFAAMGLLLLDMTVPKVYVLPAKIWLGFSALLGAVMSKVILSVLYYLILTPLALVLKLFGHDPMAARKWKKDAGSVFIQRDHKYQPKDIEYPF
ncbi:SxtJ family membrane protein [Maridesulfovibrio sp.]|uniref:SxtJ family membrane protein n=1 Tax=Maridesulfovibrio sp. TaxID=2795000 RepID=UPI0029CA4CC0|nr:SxtJ family membrane protein [Maridesulfovibrio sp.]